MSQLSAWDAVAAVTARAVTALKVVNFILGSLSCSVSCLSVRGIRGQILVHGPAGHHLRQPASRFWPTRQPDMMMTIAKIDVLQARAGSDDRNRVGGGGAMPHPFGRVTVGEIRKDLFHTFLQEVEGRP